ncbi:MAG: hypothetical protein K0S74_1768 [Chlamydiales bacterium]|nr:hypothetical protein [Chlamydiales bacterium]
MEKIFILLCIIAFIFVFQRENFLAHKEDDIKCIGILQTASHPALDAATENFVKKLEDLFEKKIHFKIFNAQGSPHQAFIAAQNLCNDPSINAYLAVGTPALQSLINVGINKPIITTAVTSLTSIGIRDNAKNLCGITDKVDADRQREIIQQAFPHIKSLALLFNPSEANSVFAVDKIKKAWSEHDIKIILQGVTTEMDVPHATMAALSKADLLLIPTDNLMASTVDIISQLAVQAKKPLVASDIMLSRASALACGVDYEECGKIAALQAYNILVGHKSCLEIGLQNPSKLITNINQTIWTKLELPEPKLNEQVEFITTTGRSA